MVEKQDSPTDHQDLPGWYDEVGAALAYADHLVFSGNVTDLYPAPEGPDDRFLTFGDTLWSILRSAGFGALLAFDPVNGLRIAAAAGPEQTAALQAAGLPLEAGPSTFSTLVGIHRTVTEFKTFRVALLIEYASHLTGAADDLEDVFVSIDIASRAARQSGSARAINPTLWLVDHPADLPDWFVLSNASLREVQLEEPNLEDRFHFARHLAARHGWLVGEDDREGQRLLQQFALECDGKPLLAMDAVAKVAQAENLGLERISDAIRVFRTGSRRNPWTSPVLRSRMQDAKAMLEAKIKGQPHAIDKTLDILARSILGLSGAQSGAMHTRPRGTLFFVGPTGVGKTELAKSVTELLFADETLCHRFDMSEFMAENSISRLIGAPPGHPGHEKGGELVNAAIRRPFSVFLFDEVEKAHPRVLDLFLQILDEGRLTDARGATAYFSEALLIFTSNIGMVGGSRADNMGMNVLPSDSHAELTLKITGAVQEHFRNKLQRPELLNRIGQNVVVFDFLSPAGISAIFDALLDRVLGRVLRDHGVRITFQPEALQSLKLLCTADALEGGRGIANRIETHFINPLARQFFLDGAREHIDIVAVEEIDGKTVFATQAAGTSDTPPPDAGAPPNIASLQHRTPGPMRLVPDDERWRDRFAKHGS